MFLDPKQRAVAIGVWISSFSAGAVIGPPLGGFLLEYFWWGSVFLVSVPMMVLLLVLGPTLLPEFRDPNAGRPDLPSAILSVAAVLAVIYGLKQIAAHGVGSRALLCSPLVFLRRRRSRRLAPSSAERWALQSSAASGLPSTVEPWPVPLRAFRAKQPRLRAIPSAARWRRLSRCRGLVRRCSKRLGRHSRMGSVTAITSALVVIGIAILVLLVLRDVRSASELAAESDRS